MRVGIIGASGYVGGELIRLLLGHPNIEVAEVTSRKYVGEYVYRVHPNLRGVTSLKFSDLDLNRLSDECDVVFLSLPHGESMKIVPELAEMGVRIIDLSADFRLEMAEDYRTWYGYEHPAPELLEKFVYGIPELHRLKIKNGRFVASPGCMAVTSIIPLAPIVKEGLVDNSKIVIDAKIGSSGAGFKPSISTHHPERYNAVRPYKVAGHRHTAEIEQELNRLVDERVVVSMSPHAVNIVRGILCTIHLFLKKDVTPQDVWRTFRSFYPNEPFIRFVKDRRGIHRLPDPKMVVGSNFCDIGFELDTHANRLVILSATDNLMKGAAGSAVHCMNLMLGLEETKGLLSPSLHPM